MSSVVCAVPATTSAFQSALEVAASVFFQTRDWLRSGLRTTFVLDVVANAINPLMFCYELATKVAAAPERGG
jgi:hypothetical protein